jgi:hypothetical protein
VITTDSSICKQKCEKGLIALGYLFQSFQRHILKSIVINKRSLCLQSKNKEIHMITPIVLIVELISTDFWLGTEIVHQYW